MNLMKLSFSYLRRRLLNTLLNVLLLSIGIATVVLLLLFTYQLEDNLYKNAEGIDVVVGAKGSPIQLILSSIYHVDSPTGNINLGEAKELMGSTMVAESVPLSLGDNFRGHRIVGTTTQYLEKYGAVVAEGVLWDYEFEVVPGAEVAANEDLKIGDTIFSSHGFSESGHTHDDHALTISGILQPTGTVIDRLILTSVETMWGIHEHHEHDDDHDHDHHHNHDHGDDHHHHHDNDHGDVHLYQHDRDDHHHHNEHDAAAENASAGHHGHHHTHGRTITDTSFLNADYNEEQITSMLIRYSNPLAAAQFPRFVNENTSMQAAAPAFEITRLLNLLGVGIDVIRLFAIVLIFASVLGIFIALLNSMKERKYDLAIMRTLGGSRFTLFSLVIVEGIIISLAGGVLGIILGHTAIEAVGSLFSEAQQFEVTGFVFFVEEWAILAMALIVGVIASIIPAYMAYKTDIAQTLAKA